MLSFFIIIIIHEDLIFITVKIMIMSYYFKNVYY